MQIVYEEGDAVFVKHNDTYILVKILEVYDKRSVFDYYGKPYKSSVGNIYFKKEDVMTFHITQNMKEE